MLARTHWPGSGEAWRQHAGQCLTDMRHAPGAAEAKQRNICPDDLPKSRIDLMAVDFRSRHEHQWSSGRIHCCHRCDPGSIPG